MKKIFLFLFKIIKWFFIIYTVLFCLLLLVTQRPWHDRSYFDSEIWKNTPMDKKENPKCIKGRMVYDLIHHYLKIGMPETEVIKILGHGYTSVTNSNDTYYGLGYCAHALDSEQLYITYTKERNIKYVSYTNDDLAFFVDFKHYVLPFVAIYYYIFIH